MVINSTAAEGSKAEFAEQFITNVLASIPNAKFVHINYRSWLHPTLKKIAETSPVKFRYSRKQYEILKPKDKAIVVKCLLNTADVNNTINSLSRLDYPP